MEKRGRLQPMGLQRVGHDWATSLTSLMKGIPWHIFPTAFSSHPPAPLSWDLSLAKTHDGWLQDLMQLRLWCLIAKNQLETQRSVRGGFVRIQREAHSSGCGPLQRARALAMECGLVGFWIHMLGECGDHPNHWGTVHSSVFWQCLGAVLPPLGVSFSLQIGD